METEKKWEISKLQRQNDLINRELQLVKEEAFQTRLQFENERENFKKEMNLQLLKEKSHGEDLSEARKRAEFAEKQLNEEKERSEAKLEGEKMHAESAKLTLKGENQQLKKKLQIQQDRAERAEAELKNLD